MTAERVAMIRERLDGALAPDALEVIDESHLHVGHAGARDGRGHFRVRIRSPRFDGRARLARHRLVFDALGEMMETDIHALAIEAEASDGS
jgi:BolA protein